MFKIIKNSTKLLADKILSLDEVRHLMVLTGRNIRRTVIKEVRLDTTSHEYLMLYLNENCKKYVFGRHKIVSKWQDVIKEGNFDVAFFNIPMAGSVVFVYKGALLLCESLRRSDCSDIHFIVGTIDLSELMTTAREYSRNTIVNDSNEVNYYDYKVIEYTGTPTSTIASNYKNGNIPRINDEDQPITDNNSNEIIYKNDIPLNYTLQDLNVPKRVENPFDELYFPDSVYELVEDTKEWLKRREWFIDRGLPWKRGILLHGPGGTGKSSFAKALGKTFGLTVNHMYLSNMTDYDFKSAWTSAIANTPCIVLLEDFDAVFNKRVAVNPKSTLHFDTILNTISGIQDSTGVILIITTNRIECIDDAIGVETIDGGVSTRPGRIDKVLYLGAMDNDNRRKLVTKILRDWPDLIDLAFEQTRGYTPAQVQEVCIQHALHRLQEEK